MIDPVRGAVFCNQCFSTKNGDGFAALQWALGLDFLAAAKLAAKHLGVKEGTEGADDPTETIDWREWNDSLAALWCLRKPGCTVEALKRAGARQAKHYDHVVIALPVWGPKLKAAAAVGWVLYNISGGTLPKFSGKKGEKPEQVKAKLAKGSKPGLMGDVDALTSPEPAGKVIWKTEGATDMLALMAVALTGHYVVANANGTMEKPGRSAEFFAGQTARIVHDNDEPGQTGGIRWAVSVAEFAAECRHVTLPGEIAKDHGRDLRDWLQAGGTFEGLLEIASGAAVIPAGTATGGRPEESGPAPASASATGALEAPADLATHTERKLLADLMLEVIGEADSKIKVFSIFHRKTATITDIGKLTQARLEQICGPVAKAKVHGSNEQIEGQYSLNDVRSAIALMAGYLPLDETPEVGRGVWQGRRESGEESDTIVLVGSRDAARWNGDKVLRHVIAPRVDGLLLDMSGGEPWYEFRGLAEYLQRAKTDRDWCQAAVDEAVALFARWRWTNQDVDPVIVAGLALATWVQTLWKWRPLVSVTGASNTGKTFLFNALCGDPNQTGIFGRLAIKSSGSTEAGIRQALARSASVVMLDEFEDSRHRAKVLETLRTSSRGDIILRGTASGRTERHGLTNIVWVAAIEVGLKREPDRNRFIMLELRPPLPENRGKLTLPPGSVLADLGQRLLAVAITHVSDARQIAATLKSTRVDGIDDRTVESYSVPAAILAALHQDTPGYARKLLEAFLATVERSEQGQTDRASLLEDILGASLMVGKGTVYTVGQILESQVAYHEHSSALEGAGVQLCRRDVGRRGDAFEATGPKVLFIDHRTACRKLLRDTEWAGQSIDQILKRTPGAEKTRRRIAGRIVRGIEIPWGENGEASDGVDAAAALVTE